MIAYKLVTSQERDIFNERVTGYLQDGYELAGDAFYIPHNAMSGNAPKGFFQPVRKK